MTRKIVITSGKGGVGKTTITACLGLSLARLGKRVMLIDGDLGLNNLDVLTEIENLVVFDLIDVLNGKCRAKQALVNSPLNNNLFILPCTHNISGTEISGQRLKSAIESVEGMFDYLLIDCPAGIDLGFHRAVSISDEALIVITPNLTSIRDADKVMSILKSYKLKSISLIANRIRGDLVLSGEMYSASDIEDTLKSSIIGVIPEDDGLICGVMNLDSPAEKAFKALAKNLDQNTGKIYDYLKKYTGFWGSIRKELKKLL